MASRLFADADSYIRLYADCIPVKGASRSAVYDLTRNEIILFQSAYYGLLKYIKNKKAGQILSEVEQLENKTDILSFFQFLEENELIFCTKNPESFPDIQQVWDYPGDIQNAIIDIDSVLHDFKNILEQLDTLGCQFVQIRSFSKLLDYETLLSVLSCACNKSFESIELILKFDQAFGENRYLNIVRNNPIVSSLTVHSAGFNKNIEIDFSANSQSGSRIKTVPFTSQIIDSHFHCGVILEKNFSQPTVANFFESKLFNNCLNKKVAVDCLGEIKNCPSMMKSFGNISTTTIQSAVTSSGFSEMGNIKKDQITVCKKCEFRYVCTDCRAFTKNPHDILSKPLKCGYDPFTGIWEDWSSNPLNQQSFNSYISKSLPS